MIPGYSGCSIFFDDKIVTKTAKSEDYNRRLQKQINKQINQSHLIHTPAIIATSFEGLYSVDMEFIPHKDAIEYFLTCSVEQVYYFTHSIKKYIDRCIEVSPISTVNFSALDQKFYSINESIMPEGLRHSFMSLPIGLCHGDLTLGNILFCTNNDNIYFIDFLDSFIESPIIDMVKIKQDVKHFWLLHLCKDKLKQHEQDKLKLIFNFINYTLEEHFNKYYWYTEYASCFEYLNFARLLPYSKNPETTIFIKERMEDIYELATK